MAFRNIPPNGFPAIPDIEDLEAVVKDVSTLKTTTAGLAEDVGDLEDQKANQITIALPFNPETEYEVGDLVYYNGLSYRCTNAHAGEWDADDFAGTTIANELSTLKSGLTNVDITSTFYTHLETGVTVSNQSWVSKCGNHIVGDIALLSPSAFTSTATALLTLAHKPNKNIMSFCAGSDREWTAKTLQNLYISASSGVIEVTNDTSASDIDVARIHLDYYTA